MMRGILVSQEYKVNPLSIKVDQTKKDTRRDAWDRDYMGNHYKKTYPKSDKRMENAKPVFVFAFFYICIIWMMSSIK